jgi:hypothetical protein
MCYCTLVYVGSEVLTAAVMNDPTIFEITPCRPMKDNQHFRRTCDLRLQSGARGLPTACSTLSCLSTFFSTRIRGVIYHKTELYIDVYFKHNDLCKLTNMFPTDIVLTLKMAETQTGRTHDSTLTIMLHGSLMSYLQHSSCYTYERT